MPGADQVTLSVAQAATLAEGGLQRIGYSADEARIIAHHLVESELMGYPALGLTRVLTIAEHPRTKEPRQPIAIVHETPASALIDGGNYVGMYAIRRAAEIALEKARAGGFALVGAHNTFLSGRNAYYLDLIARSGFAALHLASGQPVVAPLGGMAPAFGTNPIGFGMPREPHPIVFDIGTAAANHGDLVLASRLGHELPAGVAIDAQGRPTRDPVAGLAGAILSFGGHKGYGLSFAIQALGLLGGAARARGKVQDYGYLFVVFDPGLLMPRAEFQQQLDELIAKVKATPRQPGVGEIRVPSERSYAERERRQVEGIALERAIYERIEALSTGRMRDEGGRRKDEG
jgi:LDH2 family malate/lactate/ureidoglycolate dehydrogenase